MGHAPFNFSVFAVRLPGVHNEAADALARNDATTFLIRSPQHTRNQTWCHGVAGAVDRPPARLDLEHLVELVRFFLRSA